MQTRTRRTSWCWRSRADRADRLRDGRTARARRHVEAHGALRRRRATRTSTPCRDALRRSASSYPREKEDEFVARAPGCLLPLLRRTALGDRPDPGDPRGVRPHLPHAAQAADTVHPPRPGYRHARLGRRRALPGLQRLRGGEAVRARSHARALHSAADRRRGPAGSPSLRRHYRRAAVPAPRRAPGSAGRSRSRSASATRASTC